jgi:hypothetical protein
VSLNSEATNHAPWKGCSSLPSRAARPRQPPRWLRSVTGLGSGGGTRTYPTSRPLLEDLRAERDAWRDQAPAGRPCPSRSPSPIRRGGDGCARRGDYVSSQTAVESAHDGARRARAPLRTAGLRPIGQGAPPRPIGAPVEGPGNVAGLLWKEAGWSGTARPFGRGGFSFAPCA